MHENAVPVPTRTPTPPRLEMGSKDGKGPKRPPKPRGGKDRPQRSGKRRRPPKKR
jgi:hypothetical protein